MVRLPRYVVPGLTQHVIQRGTNRSAIFGTDADYAAFLGWLRDACGVHGLAVHAYVLMTNHVHLLATPVAANSIALVMQAIGRRYVRYFNGRHGRTGTLWQGRYRATLVDSDRYLLTCYRYIELNPVRAGKVATPDQYRWSSYRANALGENDPLVTPHVHYTALGADSSSRCLAYRALFAIPVAAHSLGDIREATNRGWPLGSDQFRTMITQLAKRPAKPHPWGGDRRSEAYRATTSTKTIKGV